MGASKKNETCSTSPISKKKPRNKHYRKKPKNERHKRSKKNCTKEQSSQEELRRTSVQEETDAFGAPCNPADTPIPFGQLPDQDFSQPIFLGEPAYSPAGDTARNAYNGPPNSYVNPFVATPPPTAYADPSANYWYTRSRVSGNPSANPFVPNPSISPDRTPQPAPCCSSVPPTPAAYQPDFQHPEDQETCSSSQTKFENIYIDSRGRRFVLDEQGRRRKIGSRKFYIQCNCGYCGYTKRSRRPGVTSIVSSCAFLGCAILIFWPLAAFFWIPLVIPALWDVTHKCPNCKRVWGKRNR